MRRFIGRHGEDRVAWTHGPTPARVHVDASFTGTPGKDNYTGTTSDDIFDMSQGGNDSVKALAGDDYVYMGAAFTSGDKITGGDGYDVVELEGNYSGGVVLGASTLVGVEEIDLDAGFDYSLTLNAATSSAGTQLIVYAQLLGAADSVNIDGSAAVGNLILRGGAGDDILRAGAGDDYLRTGGGDDVIDGGGGYNRISFYGFASGVTLDFTEQGHAQNTGLGMLTLSNVEDVSGTAFADTINGDGKANFIAGNGGADTLTGNGGDDWFELGPDPNGNIPTGVTISGGIGTDLVDFYDNSLSTAGVTVDLDKSGAQITGQGTITMVGIEDAAGTVFNDHLLGTKDANILYGNGGDDRLEGRGGNDTLYGDKFVFPGAGATDGPKTLYDADTPGNDTLIGGGGDDHLFGGAGADTFYFEAKSGHDAIADFAAGTDKIDINVKGVKHFSDLTIVSDGSGGSIVSWTGGASVDVAGIAPGGLSSADFIFGPLSAAAPSGAHLAPHPDLLVAHIHLSPPFHVAIV